MPQQIDAYLDPDTGDLPASSRLITGIDLIAQRIRFRLKRSQGEWFLDPSEGLPLVQWRQRKPPQVQAILQSLQGEIRLVPGVVSTANFEGTHDGLARTLTVTGDVYCEDGDVLSIAAMGGTAGARNSMSFSVSFFSRNVQGVIAAPTSGRP
jgi:hypothetical protein